MIRSPHITFAACVTAAGAIFSSTVGCASYQPNPYATRLVADGQFGRALSATDAGARPEDRLLAIQKRVYLALAEGVPSAVDGEVAQMYDMLRTQGINADRTMATVFVGERGARVWKGEPFEQAMALAAVAIHDGLEGDWGNVRAAAESSLFQIRDFGFPPAAGEVNRREAVEWSGDEGVFDYTAAESDFELGYALLAIAEDQIGATAERDETLEKLRSFGPQFDGFAEVVRSGRYNTVLVVDAGIGPQRVAVGQNGVIADYDPRWRSGNEPLMVATPVPAEHGSVLTSDVNRMSRDVRWAGLEEMRRSRAALGNALVIGGLAVAGAADNDSPEVALIGLGAAALGAWQLSTAKADTRFNELLPQRSYVALLDLPPGGSPVTLQVANRPGTRLTLPIVQPGVSRASMGYVRLPVQAVPWADARDVLYGNDQTGPLTGVSGPAALPYILGGRDVRTPSPEVVRAYHAAGLPTSIGTQQLIDLYRAEGIVLAERDGPGVLGTHILEGGNVLYTPLPASAGFARLFGFHHPPYRPRSREVRELAAELASRLDGSN